MVRLRHEQRAVLIDTLPDTANVALGGLIFGQTLGGEIFSIRTAAAGLAVWAVLVAWSLILARRNGS